MPALNVSLFVTVILDEEPNSSGDVAVTSTGVTPAWRWADPAIQRRHKAGVADGEDKSYVAG